MATIKSYTDLEQSKKLAEILPIESADMSYIQNLLAGGKYGEYKPYIGDLTPAYGQDKIRCWSLAALFNAVDFSTINLHYDNARKDWTASATIHNSTKYCTKYESTRALNLVDACYEMIIKLHEQNLLQLWEI